jgi:hypothetical protein
VLVGNACKRNEERITMEIVATGGVPWGWAVFPFLIGIGVVGVLVWFIARHDD